jgi:hypothetical protein
MKRLSRHVLLYTGTSEAELGSMTDARIFPEAAAGCWQASYERERHHLGFPLLELGSVPANKVSMSLTHEQYKYLG